MGPPIASGKLALGLLLLSLASQDCLASPWKVARDSSYSKWSLMNATESNTTTNTTTTTANTFTTKTTSFRSTTRSTSPISSTETPGSAHPWADWVGSHPGTNGNTPGGDSDSPEVSNAGPHGNFFPSSENNFSPGGNGINPGGSTDYQGENSQNLGGNTNDPSGPSNGHDGSSTRPAAGGAGDGSNTGTYPSRPYQGGSLNGTGFNGTGSAGWQNNTDNHWIGKDDGVPALTPEQIAFISSEQALAVAGFPDNDTSENANFDPSNGSFSGEITQQIWIEMDMDNWLTSYVERVPIAGQPGTRLINSTHFFRDFWLSTGEENIVVCESLYDSCNVAGVDARKRYPYISEFDAYRAAMTRQVMKVWQSGNKQAYQIISQAVSYSQITIQTAHRVFLQSDPPASTNILDVFLPALAAVTVFAPTLAPAVALLSNIYAAVNTISRRDEDDGEVLSGDIPVARTSHHDKRADDNVINDILDRVKTLETQSTKSWVENVNKGVERSAKAVDQAAKAVVAMKGLNSKVAASTITSWDFFDARVFDDLKSYPITHLKAFEKNILSWLAREDTSNNGGTAATVAVGGMKNILLGGEWAKINANKEPDSVTIPKVKDFLNALIFMQVVQNQGIYYWTQRFNTEAECKKAAATAVSDKWLASNGWYQCATVGAQSEFRMARRPTRNRGDAQVVNDLTWNPFGDFVKITLLPNSADTCFVQERSGNFLKVGGFDQASVALNNWNDGLLRSAGYNFNMGDLYNGARACQDAIGDPFQDDQPRQSAFYPGMRVQATAEQILSGGLPLCLFNLPIFQLGDAVKDRWCKGGIGSMHGASGGLRSYFTPDGNTCDDTLEYWSLQSDNKLCLTDNRNYRSPTWASRPGCEKHDRGIHLVGYRRS